MKSINKFAIVPLITLFFLALAAACQQPEPIIVEKEVVKEVLVIPTEEPKPRTFEGEIFLVPLHHDGDVEPRVVLREVGLQTLDEEVHRVLMRSSIEIKKSANGYERTILTTVRVLLISPEEFESVGEESYIFLSGNPGISFAFDFSLDNVFSDSASLEATGRSFNIEPYQDDEQEREWSFSLMDYLWDFDRFDRESFEGEVRNLAEQVLRIALNTDESDEPHPKGG